MGAMKRRGWWTSWSRFSQVSMLSSCWCDIVRGFDGGGGSINEFHVSMAKSGFMPLFKIREIYETHMQICIMGSMYIGNTWLYKVQYIVRNLSLLCGLPNIPCFVLKSYSHCSQHLQWWAWVSWRWCNEEAFPWLSLKEGGYTRLLSSWQCSPI